MANFTSESGQAIFAVIGKPCKERIGERIKLVGGTGIYTTGTREGIHILFFLHPAGVRGLIY